jgi:hypothetical protein
MKETILFTHIPKTSGTSFLKEIVEPNLGIENVKFHCHGYRNVIPRLIHNDYHFLSGHFSYGLHKITAKKIKYITFFRSPIDRCISFYYFVQQDGENPKTRHPLCDYAQSVSLKDFYKNRNFHNLQTRYTAGLLWHKGYPLFDTLFLEKQVFNHAIYNLNNRYICYGILEEREKSIELFQECFNWQSRVQLPRQQLTRNRLKIEDLDRSTLDILKKANNLDIQLYEYAVKNFNSKYKKNKSYPI